MNYKYTFDEIEKLELTSEHIELFKRLKKDEDFKLFQEFVEQEIMRKTFALVMGTPVEEGKENQYLQHLRGFARSWKSIINRINNYGQENKTVGEEN